MHRSPRRPTGVTRECQAQGRRPRRSRSKTAQTRNRRRSGKRLRRVLKWAGIVGLVRRPVLAGGFVFLYQIDRHPGPEQGLPDPDDASSTTPTARPSWASSPRRTASHRATTRCRRTCRTRWSPPRTGSFWTNKGIDPKGIIRAAFNNARGGSTQGASTITQQYVKILYLTQERTCTRKVKEAILSLKMQRQQSKQQILEGYLNTIYFGRGAYGIQAAAKAYFNKDAKDLTLREARCWRRAEQPDAASTRPTARPTAQALLERYHYVLGGMASTGRPRRGRRPTRPQQAPAEVPEDQGGVSQYGGQKGHMLDDGPEGAARASASPTSRSTAAGCGSPRRSPAGDAAAADGVKGSARSGDKELHVAVATRPARHRRAARFYGGQDYLEVPDQLGRRPAAWSGSTFKPFTLAAAHHRRLLASRAPSRATRRTSSPTATGATTRAAAPTAGNDYGAASR